MLEGRSLKIVLGYKIRAMQSTYCHMMLVKGVMKNTHTVTIHVWQSRIPLQVYFKYTLDICLCYPSVLDHSPVNGTCLQKFLIKPLSFQS